VDKHPKVARGRGIRARRGVVRAGVGGVAAALAAASLSWACTPITGNTWYDDGTFMKEGPSGTQITAYATGARKAREFQLVAGNSTTPGHESHGCMDNPSPINPNWRTSTAESGFIGLTTGPVVRSPGTWQICFRERNGLSATNPVFFTVI
jgi:hypothetical protein